MQRHIRLMVIVEFGSPLLGWGSYARHETAAKHNSKM